MYECTVERGSLESAHENTDDQEHIGADSTGATGNFAPVLARVLEREQFRPSTFLDIILYNIII